MDPKQAYARPQGGYKDLFSGMPFPVRGLKPLLGKQVMDRRIPEDAVTFWDGQYFPIRDLVYDGGADEVTLPTGEKVPGGYGFHVFVPK